MMKFTNTNLPGVIVIEPKLFGDSRGFFMETFRQDLLEEAGVNEIFVQDNHSKSTKGVLRGLHYQLEPKQQAKLVRVIQGEVIDVAVDIRKSSPTFGQWVSEVISSKNMKQLWIPEGFAHGFLTLSETSEFAYKTTNYFEPTLERCIRWDDVFVNISWPTDIKPFLSSKDSLAPSLMEAEVFT